VVALPFTNDDLPSPLTAINIATGNERSACLLKYQPTKMHE